ncbi:MAG TPA: hypothetical protein VGG20_09275 [Thermoanaerobaculia bacterium]|jgi:hypothetical protein
MSYNDLNPDQKKNFEAELRTAGIDRTSVPKQVTIDSEHSHTRDAAKVGMKIHKVTLRDLQHMKELGGVPDSRYSKDKQSDSFVEYPGAFSADRARLLNEASDADTLHAALQPQERDAINHAIRSFVLGNSAKVAKGLVQLANALSFPMDVGIAAVEELVITDKYVITGTGPQKLIAGKITIVKPNGQIVAEGVDLTISAQVIEVREA